MPIELVRSSQNLRPFVEIGEPLPLHLGAAGKVLLAWLPEDEQEALAAASAERFQGMGMFDADAFWERLRKVRTEGWAASDLRVHLEGLGAKTPELRINNEQVLVAPEGDGWVAEVPADIVGDMGEERLVVTVAPAAPGGALSLSHVSLEPL